MADLPAVPPVAAGVPDAAQMDLLTVIVRLRQIRDEQRDVDEWPWLLDRVLDCEGRPQSWPLVRLKVRRIPARRGPYIPLEPPS